MAQPTAFEVVVVFRDEVQANRLADRLNDLGYAAWVQGADAEEYTDADFSEMQTGAG